MESFQVSSDRLRIRSCVEECPMYETRLWFFCFLQVYIRLNMYTRPTSRRAAYDQRREAMSAYKAGSRHTLSQLHVLRTTAEVLKVKDGYASGRIDGWLLVTEMLMYLVREAWRKFGHPWHAVSAKTGRVRRLYSTIRSSCLRES